MGEERFDLDPLAAPLREPEVRLPDPVEQTHLRFVRDVQVEDGPVELPDDVLAGQAVLDQELVEDFPRPEEFSLERLLDESLDLFGSDRAQTLYRTSASTVEPREAATCNAFTARRMSPSAT